MIVCTSRVRFAASYRAVDGTRLNWVASPFFRFGGSRADA
jgi:hypothetical protein